MNSGVLRRTILVAEDDAEVREYLGVTLRCRGYDVQLAVDGEEVVDYLRAGGFASAVLLDIMMPNKDGWETLRDMRLMNMDVPVIMLSGMSSPLNVVQAIKSGATDFLAKPVDHKDLGRAIDQAIKSKEQSQAAEEVSLRLGKGSVLGPKPDPERFKILPAEGRGQRRSGPDSGRNGHRQGGSRAPTTQLIAACRNAVCEVELRGSPFGID